MTESEYFLNAPYTTAKNVHNGNSAQIQSEAKIFAFCPHMRTKTHLSMRFIYSL